ncbi:MAG: aldo/keto reductase, partial [Mariniblastus sp.]
IKRHELKVLQSQYMASYQKLGDHLDLYQIHSATLESGVLDNEEVLLCLNGLRKSGVMIGLSVSGPGQSETIEKAIAVEFEGERLFGSVQVTWNLLERSAELAIAKAHAAGLSVIVKEGLANGRLTARNNEESFQDNLALLNQVATARQTTVDALALAAILNQPWATTVLSGASTSDQMRSNMAALAVKWDEETNRQLLSLVETPAHYWQQRSNLVWN